MPCKCSHTDCIWHSDTHGVLSSGRDFSSPNFDRMSYSYSYCTDLTTYIGNDNSVVSICRDFQNYGNYNANLAQSYDAPWKGCRWWNSCWYSSCRSGYHGNGNTCVADGRFMGQTCGRTQECRNGDHDQDPYDAYHLSCVATADTGGSARCVPSAFGASSQVSSAGTGNSASQVLVTPRIARKQCSCSWGSANLFIFCGSDDCNGHPCVLSTGDGNKYCDFQQDNGNSLLGVSDWLGFNFFGLSSGSNPPGSGSVLNTEPPTPSPTPTPLWNP